MLTFLCPHCNTKIPAESRAIGSLPPTGGDYEWQEGNKNHTCPNCQNTFEICVRTSIETGSLLFVVRSPKPKDTSIVWYAVGTISEDFGVYASAVCQTEAEANLILPNHSKAHYAPLHLLKLTSEGFFDAHGNKITEPSYYEEVINYLEIS